MSRITFALARFRPAALSLCLLLGVAVVGCATPDRTKPSPKTTEVPTALQSGTPAAAPSTPVPTVESTASPTIPPQPPAGSTASPSPKPTEAPPPPPRVKPPRMNHPAYSVQAFLWYRPETADRDLGLILAMGFGWVKQEFAWRDMEGARKGAFDWSKSDNVVYAANRKKVDILARVDSSPDWAAPGCFNAANSTMGPPKRTQDWLDFLTAFASRYKQRVRAYEIWNEPNLAREWCNQPPSPAAYAQFLKASYAAIKSVDPDAMIISGGLDPTTCCADGVQAMPDTVFLQDLYDAMGGNSTGYFDVLGAHAAGYKAEPEADPAVVANDPILTNHDPSPPELRRIYCFRHVEDIRQIMVERGDVKKQIAITEFGWTSDPVNSAYAWFRVDEQTKADRIVRAYEYAKANWSPWIGVMSLIYMANPDWTKSDEKYWWAITEPDGTPRAAYVRLKAMEK
jgi:polysaccharide biosynthesis protein PslG